MNSPLRIFSLPSLGRTGVLTALLLLGACGDSADRAHSAAPGDTPVSVHVFEVQSAPLAQTLVRTGTLRARRSVRLHSQEEGRIEQVAAYVGDRVAAGVLLVKMDDRLLRAELNRAEATRNQAAQDYARVQRLADRKLVSTDELQRAETALRVAEADESLLKTRLGYATLTAPFAAQVSERMVEPGDAVPKFAHLLTLVDPDSLYTEVPVSELLLPTLKTGDRVQFSIDALGATRFNGRIERIHPTIDPATRQGVVEIALNPVPDGVQAGQLCRVYLPGVLEHRRSIPLAALRQDTSGEYVFVVATDQTVQRRSVRSGVALDDRIEILDGLADGDRVVSRGFINLTEGKPVLIVTDTGTAP